MLASSQKDFLAASLQGDSSTPQALMTEMLGRVTAAPFDDIPQAALQTYLVAGGAWSGSPSQVQTRAAGLARLLVGSAEYQLI
jgi:hypothetical protein